MEELAPRRKAVTSADVARAAGVSRTTVSLVLNGVETIALAEQTRARVQQVAAELGYVPHSGAQALRRGYSGIVLMPSAATRVGRLVGDWTTQLEDELNTCGLTFVTYGSRRLAPTDAARAWSQLRPVAVLTFGPSPLPEEAVEILRAHGTRALLTTGDQPVPGTHVIATSHAEAAAIGVRHLIERGRRRLGIVRPRDPGLAAIESSRHARAARACQEAGIELIDLPMSYDRDSAVEVARACPARGIDGVHGFDDDYALLLLGALAFEGVSVPEQVAVVGSDDLVEGTVSRPRLSTVRISFPPAREIAHVIRDLVHEKIEPGISYAVPPELIHRESS